MVDVRPARPGELESVERELVACLDERYGPPPWCESPEENAREGARLVEAGALPGAVTALALDGRRLVGFAQVRPGELFAADLRAADPVIALAWPAPLAELHQLLVSASVGGRGVGSRLHDTVMDPVRVPALLITHPDATTALRLYARRGWTTLATTSFGPSNPRVVLGRRPAPAADAPV
ncbi:MAG TPA: GNAT family N-acetyltransferase [Ornithinibacter sp.]|nr:GNAT family N-acetyltransferase [Ornithinibacter sp.]